MSLDDNGEVSLEDGYIIGKSAEIFGDKIFEAVPVDFYTEIEKMSLETEGVTVEPMEKLKQALHTQTVKAIVEGLLKTDDGKYYIPEMIRHSLKFKYEKGARPKVLSLLSIK